MMDQSEAFSLVLLEHLRLLGFHWIFCKVWNQQMLDWWRCYSVSLEMKVKATKEM